jgi:hypothetical protein
MQHLKFWNIPGRMTNRKCSGSIWRGQGCPGSSDSKGFTAERWPKSNYLFDRCRNWMTTDDSRKYPGEKQPLIENTKNNQEIWNHLFWSENWFHCSLDSFRSFTNISRIDGKNMFRRFMWRGISGQWQVILRCNYSRDDTKTLIPLNFCPSWSVISPVDNNEVRRPWTSWNINETGFCDRSKLNGIGRRTAVHRILTRSHISVTNYVFFLLFASECPWNDPQGDWSSRKRSSNLFKADASS